MLILLQINYLLKTKTDEANEDMIDKKLALGRKSLFRHFCIKNDRILLEKSFDKSIELSLLNHCLNPFVWNPPQQVKLFTMLEVL